MNTKVRFPFRIHNSTYFHAFINIGKIVGLELSEEHLRSSLRKTRELKLESVVEFHKAEKYRIPFPDGEFNALISEFIIFPTLTLTNIGVNEMARVLREGGRIIINRCISY